MELFEEWQHKLMLHGCNGCGRVIRSGEKGFKFVLFGIHKNLRERGRECEAVPLYRCLLETDDSYMGECVGNYGIQSPYFWNEGINVWLFIC